MSLSSLVCNSLAAAAQYPGYRRFVSALKDVESTQRTLLRQLLTAAAGTEFGRQENIAPDWTPEEMAERLPVTCYGNWEGLVEKQREDPGAALLNQGCERYEPTSGSTAMRKWIPYTRRLLDEFDSAAAPWLYDLARRYPTMLKGRHYWSLSWLPNDLRGEGGANTTDDIELFPWWKRWVMQGTMAVPGKVALCPTLEQSLFLTLVHLVSCSDLTLISVWSPTFLIELLRNLSSRKGEVAAELARNGCRRAALVSKWDGDVTPDFLRGLWPRLQLVSSWDTSTSSIWAQRLKELFPDAAFQGKGVWATEGVLTIPFADRYPLALTSHYYEFRVLDDGPIVPAWKLEPGMMVQPILSTGSGLWRYALDDRLEVSGFLESCPCFTFKGRLGGVDMVGEKLDHALAEDVLCRLSKATGCRCVSLLARPFPEETNGKPHYTVLAEGPGSAGEQITEQAEQMLNELHHYRLAREMGQLGPAGAVVTPNAFRYYVAATGLDGTPLGARKLEPVLLLPQRLSREPNDR